MTTKPLRSPFTRASLAAALVAVGCVTGLGAQAVCPAPVAWRIAELDDRFGLTRVEASDAVRQAGILWATALGSPFLFPESAEGLPISFVYDHRQERAAERRRRMSEVEAQGRAVEAAREDLARLREELERQRGVLEILDGDFRARLAEHNAIVDDWNRRGGAPAAEIQRLGDARAALDREQESLDARSASVNDLVDRVNGETGRVNDLIAELNEAEEELEEIPTRTGEPAAEYRDTRRTIGPFAVSRTRSIDVYQFDNRDDLVILLARQLGLALGIATSDVSGAIMSPDTRARPGAGPPRLGPTDEAAARALCSGSRE